MSLGVALGTVPQVAERLPGFPGECASVWLSVTICSDIFHVRVESNLKENDRNKNRNVVNANEFVRKNDPKLA